MCGCEHQHELEPMGSFRHSVDDALSIEASGDLEGALDALFASIDAMFKTGQFDEVDQFIKDVVPRKFSVEFLIGLLTATLIADDKLQHRLRFYQTVRQYFETAGEPAGTLLFGLDRLPKKETTHKPETSVIAWLLRSILKRKEVPHAGRNDDV